MHQEILTVVLLPIWFPGLAIEALASKEAPWSQRTDKAPKLTPGSQADPKASAFTWSPLEVIDFE